MCNIIYVALPQNVVWSLSRPHWSQRRWPLSWRARWAAQPCPGQGGAAGTPRRQPAARIAPPSGRGLLLGPDPSTPPSSPNFKSPSVRLLLQAWSIADKVTVGCVQLAFTFPVAATDPTGLEEWEGRLAGSCR